MMAARAGAESVIAAEVCGHMAETAERAVAANGASHRVNVVHKDVRQMLTSPRPDGSPADMTRLAHVLVHEVFDSGLIGEGALHILAAATSRLLVPSARVVPSAAQVYAMPVQLNRLGSVHGVDVAVLNQYHWRPDYQGMDLAVASAAPVDAAASEPTASVPPGRQSSSGGTVAGHHDWRALAEPLQVFSFDLTRVADLHMSPESVDQRFRIHTGGVANAVVFWFDLQLDEHTRLSTSPFQPKGPTWQQAVQWLPETVVTPGETLDLTAAHDTYSISFKVVDEQAGLWASGVPLRDEAMWARYSQLQQLGSTIAKSCVQSPLEYRRWARAAVRLASRPADFAADPAQAAAQLMRMMM